MQPSRRLRKRGSGRILVRRTARTNWPLEQASLEVTKLPQDEQERFAAWILEELADERGWDEAFAGSLDALARLADEALSERNAGTTQPLDPDKL